MDSSDLLLIPEDSTTPDAAEPIEPVESVDAPALDPSNSLVPVEPNPIIEEEVIPIEESSETNPVDTADLETVRDNNELESEASEAIVEPETVIPDGEIPETVEPIESSTGDDFELEDDLELEVDTGVPFEPDLGGTPLEDVLDPGDEPISPENGASDGEAIDSENGEDPALL
ncbi:MAG: hypothetical protein HLUCCA11_06285 [Phormidesmis priestleyi Ana]|uniref:Uncharacterized protein n=1 Tax=Phormidesmis priestleyi Ana TaxID=1666911 RepID=A0A0P7Z0F2_9CYAN|nr:MAG: hypothetical protein HLUCCA11_06285 [Phormidesmis priestleyi Ana]